MAYDPAFIERIVASVLEQLQSPVAARAKSAGTTASSTMPSEIGLTHAVVTAAVLENTTIPAGTSLVLGPKSVLTPSAHDWLRQHKVSWKRGRSGATSSTPSATARWQVLASTITPTVRSFLDQISRLHASWKRQLVGSWSETAESATRIICTAEVERVLVVSNSADIIACKANRSERVRAVVIQSAEHLRMVEPELSPNVVVLNPQAKSLMEMRHIVQACASLGAPRIPD